MFYGEENLPTNDTKLRNEIIEWTNHFPYLRITGEQMPVYFGNNVLKSDNVLKNYDEILAIHPPIHGERKSAILYANRTQDDRYHDDELTGNRALANDIEKCLRITSGPLLSRRAQNSRTAHGIRTICPVNQTETNFTQAMQNRTKHNLKSALVSVRSNYDIGTQFSQKLYGSFDVDRLHSVPYSARFIKIPRMKSEIGDLNTMTANKSNMIRVKTATLVPISRPLRNSITLPAINIEPKYFDRNSSDAISALIYQNTNNRPTTNTSVKTIKKRSESE